MGPNQEDRRETRTSPHPADHPAGRYWARSALGLLLLAAVAFPFFSLVIAIERRSPSIQRLDTGVADRLNALANDNGLVLDASLALTRLGNTATAVAVFVVVATVLWASRSRRLAAYVAATGLGLALRVPTSKVLVGRPRPVVDAPVTELPGSASFPSGHAMTALAMFGCLAVVALWSTHPPRPVRWAVVGLAVALGIVVGLTRLTLGVHFVSDVVAGWSLGAAWLAVTTWALSRRDHERSTTPEPVGRAAGSHSDGPSRPVASALALPAAWVGMVLAVVAAGLIITGPLAAPAIAEVDTWITRSFLDVRSEALTALARAGSAPANTMVVVAVTLGTALALAQITRGWRASAFLVVCVGGESLAYLASSQVVGRMRPDVVDLTSGLPDAASWPSGHVAAAVALYGAIAVLLAPTRRRTTLAAAAVVVLAIIVVGDSRIYLAAHYASDVVAGAALGALWLFLCVRLLRPAPVRSHHTRLVSGATPTTADPTHERLLR